MTLSIRRATPADAELIARYNAALAWESEHKTLDAATLARGVRAVLADPTKGFYTLAERGGEPVGQAMVTFEWSDWRDGCTGGCRASTSAPTPAAAACSGRCSTTSRRKRWPTRR